MKVVPVDIAIGNRLVARIRICEVLTYLEDIHVVLLPEHDLCVGTSCETTVTSIDDVTTDHTFLVKVRETERINGIAGTTCDRNRMALHLCVLLDHLILPVSTCPAIVELVENELTIFLTETWLYRLKITIGL